MPLEEHLGGFDGRFGSRAVPSTRCTGAADDRNGQEADLARRRDGGAVVCQLPTRATQAPISFDHFVGAGKQARGNIETERLGGLEIDYKLEFGRLLHGKIAGLLTSQDTINV